jgi:hypothetical protein
MQPRWHNAKGDLGVFIAHSVFCNPVGILVLYEHKRGLFLSNTPVVCIEIEIKNQMESKIRGRLPLVSCILHLAS